ncbi:MAG: (deoxy)nucleoside triphosphate pyrophosphohydrolase [Bacillota bacterium]
MKNVTAAIIEKDGKILITQRSREDKLAHKWEFPGGKDELDETPEECLVREIKEELNLDIIITRHFMNNNYSYQTGEIQLISYLTEIIGGELKLNVHEAAEWVEADRLKDFDFVPADIEILYSFFELYGRTGRDS